jgi:peptidyl-prolyl cis-trans isomerase SurA
MQSLRLNIIFFLLVCAFGNVFAESLNKIVAVVNDNVITNHELTNQMSLVKKQVAQQGVAQPAPDVLRKQVLQHMIDIELQLQLAKTNGLEISSEQLNDTIRKIAARHKMSLKQLKAAIAADGIVWSQYRKDISKELLISKLQQDAVGPIQVTDSQVDDYISANKKEQNLLYHVKDILLPLPEAPTPEKLKTVRAQAKSLLSKLQKGLDFGKAAVELSSNEVALKGGDLGERPLAALPKIFADSVRKMKVGEVAGPIRAPNGYHIIQLADIKGEEPKKIVTLTHVRHILLKSQPGISSEQQEKRLNNIAQQIKHGSSFEKIARSVSDDKASAVKGGDLGWLHKGETVPAFEKAYEKLKKGELSSPIKSQYGWHLIQVLGTKEIDDTKAYQRQQVKEALYQRKFHEAVQNWLQVLRANAYVKVMI